MRLWGRVNLLGRDFLLDGSIAIRPRFQERKWGIDGFWHFSFNTSVDGT
jgi:hypothetical protein